MTLKVLLKEWSMDGLAEMLAMCGGKNRGTDRDDVSYDVEVIRSYMDRPKLQGLEHGDILRQVPGLDGKYSIRGDNKPVVFDRYLTEAEKAALMARGGMGDALEQEDIVICDKVAANSVVAFTMDSRLYLKVE
jgi:hypothetical protein